MASPKTAEIHALLGRLDKLGVRAVMKCSECGEVLRRADEYRDICDCVVCVRCGEEREASDARIAERRRCHCSHRS
jgi:hypothetical protein